MRIGIIGAGNIGGNLTRRLTALGHDVAVANSRGPETLAPSPRRPAPGRSGPSTRPATPSWSSSPSR